MLNEAPAIEAGGARRIGLVALGRFIGTFSKGTTLWKLALSRLLSKDKALLLLGTMFSLPEVGATFSLSFF